MDFKAGFETGKLDIVSLNKKQVYDKLNLVIDQILRNDLDYTSGQDMAHILSYFQPPMKKNSDMSFITTALLKRKSTYGAHYKSFALYQPGIGLMGTDGKRLHILKNFKPDDLEKVYYIPESKAWASESEMKATDISYQYPDVKSLLAMKKDFKEISIYGVENVMEHCIKQNPENDSQYLFVLDDTTIIFEKKYVNDIINTMDRNAAVFIKSPCEPMFIEDEKRLVLLMPMAK
jgi:hypothetical protein